MPDSSKVVDEIRRKYRTAAVFDLLESFLEKGTSEYLPRTISFEKEIEEKTAEILRKDREVGIVAVALCQLKNQFLFVYRVIETKLAYLVKSMIYALNTDNHLLLALSSRSLLEHAGSLSYLVERTRKKVDALRARPDSSSIRQHLEELRLIYVKLFYGTKFFKEPGVEKAIHVNDLIDKYLQPEVGAGREWYDYLSDFVHPNFGSNVLVSSGALGEGIVDPPINDKEEIVQTILGIDEQLLRYLDQKVWDFAAFALLLDDYLGRALTESVGLNEIFAELKLKWEGDGQTKESAIRFTNARTHLEHIEMQARYLVSNAIVCTGPRRAEAVDSDFIYDVYPAAGREAVVQGPTEGYLVTSAGS